MYTNYEPIDTTDLPDHLKDYVYAVDGRVPIPKNKEMRMIFTTHDITKQQHWIPFKVSRMEMFFWLMLRCSFWRDAYKFKNIIWSEFFLNIVSPLILSWAIPLFWILTRDMYPNDFVYYSVLSLLGFVYGVLAWDFYGKITYDYKDNESYDLFGHYRVVYKSSLTGYRKTSPPQLYKVNMEDGRSYYRKGTSNDLYQDKWELIEQPKDVKDLFKKYKGVGW